MLVTTVMNILAPQMELNFCIGEQVNLKLITADAARNIFNGHTHRGRILKSTIFWSVNWLYNWL